MGFVGDIVSGIFGGGNDDAADASLQASQTQAAYQTNALNYLKEREEIPRQFSEQALKGLGGLYGMEGGTGSQHELINQAIKSPLYQSIMGGKKVGEESILRNASATGGFRSGNMQSNLYDYNTQLSNQALLQSYNDQLAGLTGLAGLPSNANQIASSTAGIGQTLGQGQIAAAQANQQSSQNSFGNLLGLASLAVSMFSDRRLKNNLEKIGEVNGHNWYKWDWNIVAQKMGLKGQSEGVLADEIVKTDPDCITFIGPWLAVNYTKLGIFPEV